MGIPTCVGIGPTKTLAKLANHIAKSIPELDGFCDLTDEEIRAHWLVRMPASDGSPACDKRLEVGQILFQIGNDIVPHPLGLAFGVAILGGRHNVPENPTFFRQSANSRQE